MEADRKSIATWLAYAIPCVLVACYRVGIPSMVCDDAFITLTMAANLADNDGLVFTAGERIYVTTAPLWALLLAAVRLITSDVIVAVTILGTVFELAFVCGMVWMGRVVFGGLLAGSLAAVLIVTNPVFLLTSSSGMELPLQLFLIVSALVLATERRHAAALSIAALAVWVRIDSLVLLGVCAAWFLWCEREALHHSPFRVLRASLPGLCVLTGYALFGWLYFGEVLPASVQRKSEFSPELFSESWWSGAGVLLSEFTRTFTGRQAYWYRHPTWHGLILLPLVAGLVLVVRDRVARALPVLAFTCLYAAAYVASGARYAVNFPWYFVPILPGLYLVAAWGFVRGASAAASALAPARQSLCELATVGIAAIAWVSVAAAPIESDTRSLVHHHLERERSYAAATLWLGRHLEPRATIASNEIGTIGFYVPDGFAVLDILGLLRTREERAVDSTTMVRSRRPEAILQRSHFHPRERDWSADYAWYRFRSLDVGVRRDLAPALEAHLSELPDIHRRLNLSREAGRERS